jgi:hypothetical protein
MKTEATVIFAGANAGGTDMASVIADANSRAHDVEFAVHLVDPNGENLSRLAAFAAGRGLRTTTQQQPIEAALASRTDAAPLGIFIDAPRSIATAIEAAAATGRPTLLYVVILLATGDLLGVRAVLTGAERAVALQLASFFNAIGGATARSGASAVFGPSAPARNADLQPLIRRWFADHMVANVYKLLFDLPPVNAPVELTRDGQTTMPLFIHDSGATWIDPQELVQTTMARPPMAIEPGSDFVIAEIGPLGDVRLHEARLRRRDRQAALRNASVPPTNVAGIGWESVERAIQRITQNTISPTFPVRVTD